MKIRKAAGAFLALLLIAALSLGAFAAEDNTRYSSGHFYYHDHSGYVSICGYLGRETEVKIPASIAGKPVSEIESGSFRNCGSIETIIVPDTVVMAYPDSFQGAANLKKIISHTVGLELQADEGVVIEYRNETNDPQPAEDAAPSPETGAGAPKEPAARDRFVDVRRDDYFCDAVLWAAEAGITTGTGEATFSPHATCTRAQVVTFLWRLAGSPETEGSCPFTDVEANAYYAEAVLWAAQMKITNGTSETTFSPNATVTRAQAAAMLYRHHRMDTMELKENPFTDVTEGAYYYDAVLWAAKVGITNGTTATTFSPDAVCTRAQIVTFLYRYTERLA